MQSDNKIEYRKIKESCEISFLIFKSLFFDVE